MMINISKIITVFFPLFLVLSQYKIFSVNLGFFVFQGLTAFILTMKFRFKFQKNFLYFLLSICTAILFSLFLYGELYHGTFFYYLNGIFLILVVVTISSYMKLSNMYNWFLVFGLFVTVIVLLQGLYMAVSGTELAPINILPVMTEQERLWEVSPRPSGIFTEPQLYASFVLPLFLLTVLNQNYKSSFVLVIGVLFSGSTYGVLVICALIPWLLISSGRLMNIKFLGGIFVLLALLVTIFYTTGFFDKAIEKLVRTDITQGIRVAKAPILFWEMTLSEKLIGMESTVDVFINQHIQSFPWLMPYLANGSHLLGYVTGLFGLAIYFGVLPMLLFLWMLQNIFVKGDRFQKGMVIIIFLHSISATILFNGYFVFFFTLLFANSFNGNSKIKYWNFN